MSDVPLPDRDTYLDRWAALHGGYDPRGNTLVRWWLSWVYVLARPLARARVRPDAVTVAGGLVAGAAAALAVPDGRWVLLAAVVVVLSGLVDNLDGAVAVLTDRTSRWGHVLDSLVDRVSDLLYLLALWLAGAPGEVCAGGGALMLLQEYVRERAASAGMVDVGIVTVWERPTRVIVTAVSLFTYGVYADELWLTLGAYAWVVLGLVGLSQLVVVVRRRLSH